MENVTIMIEGMTCSGCAGSITRRLQDLAGVASVEVSLQPGVAKIGFDPAKTSIAALEQTIEDAGFDVVR